MGLRGDDGVKHEDTVKPCEYQADRARVERIADDAPCADGESRVKNV